MHHVSQFWRDTENAEVRKATAPDYIRGVEGQLPPENKTSKLVCLNVHKSFQRSIEVKADPYIPIRTLTTPANDFGGESGEHHFLCTPVYKIIIIFQGHLLSPFTQRSGLVPYHVWHV